MKKIKESSYLQTSEVFFLFDSSKILHVLNVLLSAFKNEISEFFVHVSKMSQPSLMWNEQPLSLLAFLSVLEAKLARNNSSELRKPKCNKQEQMFENKQVTIKVYQDFHGIFS